MARKKRKFQPSINHCKKRGRNTDLIRMRNVKLVKRYHALSEVQRLRSDDVLRILSTEEFFISEQRIWHIIKQNLDLLV
jgi:hypothetical protein